MNALPSTSSRPWVQRFLGIMLLWLFGSLGASLYDSRQYTTIAASDDRAFPTPHVMATALQSTFFAPGGVHWTEQNGVLLMDEDLESFHPSIVSIGYTYAQAPNDTINISFLELWYIRAVPATLQYFFLHPIQPRHTPLPQDGFVHSESWQDVPYRSARAHQQKAVCLTATSQGCYEWYVIYRYGPYLIRIAVTSSTRAIDDRTIRTILETTTTTIEANLTQ